MNVSVGVPKAIFNKVYLDYLEDETDTQIYFGGSSSGKSVFLAQRCIMDLMKGGRNYLCIRNVKRYVKASMFNELVRVIMKWQQDKKLFSINLSDLTITCTNGYQILFVGLDDVQKIKSIRPVKGNITDIWIEEATEVMESDVKELEKRLRGKSKVSKRMILSFNPILQSHWIFEKYFSYWEDEKTTYRDETTSILKTTYKDNRFLTDQDRRRLENETDPYYRDVYTLGNWGVLGSVIFKNWETRDLHNEFIDINGIQTCIIDTFDNYKNGLDFGFSGDPNAVIRTHYDKNHKTIYVVDELYEREMQNDRLAEELRKMIGHEVIVTDTNEPRSRVALVGLGIQAIPARKGKDSVNFGIDWLKQQTIIVDSRCQNFKNEIQQYKWREDKDGKALKEPVKKNDHLLDALRYAYEFASMYGEVKAVRAFY